MKKCPTCGGTKKTQTHCSRCNGNGTIRHQNFKRCRTCKGVGVINHTCSTCGGTGRAR